MDGGCGGLLLCVVRAEYLNIITPRYDALDGRGARPRRGPPTTMKQRRDLASAHGHLRRGGGVSQCCNVGRSEPSTMSRLEGALNALLEQAETRAPQI